MRQSATALALIAAFVAALALYVIAHDTRRLEVRVQAMERATERAEADIAAARAELSHLSRPERIEPLARAMGLGPPTRQQFVTTDRLPRRERP
ncbi:MAG: cell division protein FtsL [Hyphomicrobiaceae bacterium]